MSNHTDTILREVKSGGETYHAWTGWCVQDVQVLRPEWCENRCKRFLEKYGDVIVERMIDAGWHTIHDILSEREVEDYDDI